MLKEYPHGFLLVKLEIHVQDGFDCLWSQLSHGTFKFYFPFRVTTWEIKKSIVFASYVGLRFQLHTTLTWCSYTNVT